MDNIDNTFDAEQIAYIYRFDPFGIEYYMRKTVTYRHPYNLDNMLNFKDAVYVAIFGDFEKRIGRFYFNIVNDKVVYVSSPPGGDRTKIYSNAEVLFGSHVLIDINWTDFVIPILESVFNVLADKFDWLNNLSKSAELYQLLFYSGSLCDNMNDAAGSVLEEYALGLLSVDKTPGYTIAKIAFGVITGVLGSIADSIVVNDLVSIRTCERIKDQDYRTVFEDKNIDMTIEDFINKYTNS